MQVKINNIPQNFKIVFSLIFSFIITVFVGNNFFLANTPRINTSYLASLFSKKVTPTPTVTEQPQQSEPAPTIISALQPTLTPILRQISRPSPTTKPIPTIRQPPSAPLVSIEPTNPPVPTKAPGISCPQSSGNSYGSIDAINVGDNVPAESHPDKNIHVRGYTETKGQYSLIELEGGVDEKGPRLSTIVGSNPPIITGLYRVNTWDWSRNQVGPPDTTWPVSILGVLAQPGQPVSVADSGYDVSLGYDAIVLYADESTVTLKYTREDSVAAGYTVHIEDICVDPNLIRAYQNFNAQGRGELPAVRGGDEVGVARTNEVKMAIRDTGQFLEPRSRKDWW